MEMQYSKKIKESKANLLEKTRTQSSLMNEITNLRTEFKTHQEEITKVGEQLEEEEVRESIKHTKKNSSPGLIKKSLQNDKKHEKKQSPTAHQESKQLITKFFG